MRARWIKLDSASLAMIRHIPAQMAGAGLIAAANYSSTGELTDNLDALSNVVFQIIKDAIDSSEDEYNKASERNRDRVQKRWHKIPSDTSGINGIPVDTSGINGIPVDTSGYQWIQNRIDKNRLDIDKSRLEVVEERPSTNTAESYILQAFPNLTPGNIEILYDICSTHDPDLIKHIVDITAEKRSFRYFEGTVISMDEQGIKTVSEAKAAEDEHRKRKANAVGGKPNPALNYEQREPDDAYAGFAFMDLSKAPSIGDI